MILGVNKGTRPIKIIFNNVHLKNLVLRNSVKFKNFNIIDTNDLTKEQIIERKEIRVIFVYKDNLEKLGKNAKIQNTMLILKKKSMMYTRSTNTCSL